MKRAVSSGSGRSTCRISKSALRAMGLRVGEVPGQDDGAPGGPVALAVEVGGPALAVHDHGVHLLRPPGLETRLGGLDQALGEPRLAQVFVHHQVGDQAVGAGRLLAQGQAHGPQDGLVLLPAAGDEHLAGAVPELVQLLPDAPHASRR